MHCVNQEEQQATDTGLLHSGPVDISFREGRARGKIDERDERRSAVCALEREVGESELLEKIRGLDFGQFCGNARISLANAARSTRTDRR